MKKVSSKTATVVAVGLILAVGTFAVIKSRGGSSSSAVEKMVARGDLSGAAHEVSRAGFEDPSSLKKVQKFSMLVLRQGLKEHDPYERCYAAAALAKGGEDTGMRVLRAAFDAPEPTLKMAAIDGLSEINDDESRAMLKSLYTASAAPEQRVVLDALAKSNDPEVLGLLIKAANNNDQVMRLIAIRGLARTGDKQVIAHVRELLSNHKDSLERVEIGRALILLGDRNAVDLVNVSLHDPKRPEVRAIAALALGDSHDPAQLPALHQSMADVDTDVRLATAMALTHYGDQTAVSYLTTAIKNDDALTRQHIGELLEGIDFHNGRPVLLAAISSPDSNLSMSATRAIGLLGGENEVGVLAESLRASKDPIQRAGVAWALGRIGRPACIPQLMAMVLETDPAVRYTAADALGKTASGLLGTKTVHVAHQDQGQNI